MTRQQEPFSDVRWPMRPVRQVVVVGAGVMGAGIGHVLALSGFETVVVDRTSEQLDRARAAIAASNARLISAGRRSADEVAIASERVRFETGTDSAAQADLVIESVFEDIQIKRAVVAELAAICAPDVVIGTNTSQFQIGRIAEGMVHPERFLGMHWSNPPIMMSLVELVRSALTSDEAVAQARAVLERCGKNTVVCTKDVPGFISNRLSNVLFMEALRLLDEEVASAEEIDAVAREMLGHKMGPLATLDLAGLDTAVAAAAGLDAAYAGGRFAAPPILERTVAEGRLGRKSGAGFFEYAG